MYKYKTDQYAILGYLISFYAHCLSICFGNFCFCILVEKNHLHYAAGIFFIELIVVDFSGVHEDDGIK